MRLVEYRIFVPFRWDQCRIASAYSVNRRTREETGGGDGFEILESGDFEEDGNPGHYVHRMIHCKAKVPGFVRWAVPNKYAHILEVNRNAFPHTITVFRMQPDAEFFLLHTETRHVVYEQGMELPENLIGLSEEDLRIREIVYLDLLNGSGKKEEFDLHGFSCEEAGIGELVAPNRTNNDIEIPEWVGNYTGAITLVVKVVKFKFQWRGIQTAIEALIAKNIFYSTYLDTHRAMVKWSPIWSGMTLEEVWQMENRIREELAQQNFDKT
jgi:hypothetical protein